MQSLARVYKKDIFLKKPTYNLIYKLHQRMARIFSCLAVISVLVIAMATEVPTPVLATKMRDSITYQITKEMFSPNSSSVKIIRLVSQLQTYDASIAYAMDFLI